MFLPSRRRFLLGAVAAPAVILTPSLLMKVNPFVSGTAIRFPNVYPDLRQEFVEAYSRQLDRIINPPILVKAIYADLDGKTVLVQQEFKPFLLQPGDQMFFDMKLPSVARVIDLAMEYKTGEPYEMQTLERAGQRLSLSRLRQGEKLSVRLEQAGFQAGERSVAIARSERPNHGKGKGEA